MNELIKKTITCTVCPIGCKIDVTMTSSGEIRDISGNTCKRGAAYAEAEFTNPVRTLTTTVKLENSEEKLLPVRTSAPIPKGKLFDAMAIVSTLTVSAPIVRGAVVVHDFVEKGIDLVACKSVE